MSEFTISRVLGAPRERVWQALTQPDCFEQWLPAKPGTAVLDVRTGGGWSATVVSGEGEEIPLTGSYHAVFKPERLVMTVPGGLVTAITLTAASADTTRIGYGFDVDESLQAVVTGGVDDILKRVSAVLARIG